MRKIIISTLCLLLMVGCAWLKSLTPKDRVETMVVSFETIATTAFPMAKIYIQEREVNGSLKGNELLQAKKNYNLAADKFIQVVMEAQKYIKGSPSTTMASLAPMLMEVAKLLANAAGGRVDPVVNTLTLPKGGAK